MEVLFKQKDDKDVWMDNWEESKFEILLGEPELLTIFNDMKVKEMCLSKNYNNEHKEYLYTFEIILIHKGRELSLMKEEEIIYRDNVKFGDNLADKVKVYHAHFLVDKTKYNYLKTEELFKSKIPFLGVKVLFRLFEEVEKEYVSTKNYMPRIFKKAERYQIADIPF